MVLPILELGLIFIFGAALSYVARMLRQPLILAYVGAGVLIGPLGFKLITDVDTISVLGELGVAFLLFVAGLELDFRKIKSVGKISLLGGATQITLTVALGMAVVIVLGMEPILGIYVGMLFAFSSTMFVAKHLVDKNEVDTLHGRTMLSILLIQDVVAIIALTLMTQVGAAAITSIFWVVTGVAALFLCAYILNRFMFPYLFEFAAESKEMLFFTSIAICFLFMGFSYGLGMWFGGTDGMYFLPIGAFIAGISLAGLPYNIEISSEISFVRDFFAILFFATLGMQINLFVISDMFSTFVILLIMIMVVKPLLLGLIYLSLGYGLRASIDTGMGMGQASEFSFILAMIGFRMGHFSKEFYSLLISVVVVTMIFTPYMMKCRKKVHAILKARGAEKRFKARYLQRMEKLPREQLKNHIILVGGGVTGRKVLDFLIEKRKKFIVVERTPDTAKVLTKQGIYTVFGEASHEDVLIKAGLNCAKLLVITIPDIETSIFAVREAKRLNNNIKILVRAHTNKDAQELREAGADFIIVPELVSGAGLVKEMNKYI